MTALLEQAIDRLRTLPRETQDDLARMLLRLAGESDTDYRLTVEEKADLLEAESEVERGGFASEDQINALWNRHGA